MKAKSASMCHPDKPVASRGMCQPCYKRWLRSTAKTERPPVPRSTWAPRAKTKAKCHPEERDRGHGMCRRCYAKWYRDKNRKALSLQSERSRLLRKYGITPEQRDALLTAQHGRCAICGATPYRAGTRLHIDHCHTTGRVRGLLCARCNWYLAKVDADPSILHRIAEYRGQK